MHGPSDYRKAGLIKVSSNWERCILGVYGFGNAYDTIDQHGMRQMLRVYGVGGKLLKAVQSFYIDSSVCVRVRNDVSKWFPINVGLR